MNKLQIPFIVIVCLSFSCSCHTRSSTPDPLATADSSVQKGRVLAATWCGLCHQLPDPSLLDKKSWVDNVLPGMAPRLGLVNEAERIAYDHVNTQLGKKYYPSDPMLKKEDWQHIVDYYKASAPDSLPRPVRDVKPIPALPIFAIATPDRTLTPPSSCLVKIDTLAGRRGLFVADAKTFRLFRFDAALRISDSISTGGPLVDLIPGSDKMLACNIGYLNPTDNKLGTAAYIGIGPGVKMRRSGSPLFEKLARPVQLIAADLNQDGRTDYLVCEFGNLAGSLSWMENTRKGTFVKHVLRDMPGAIKAYVQDIDHDGLPDIIALFAQGDEGIFLYHNKGNGQFEETRLLRFPPVYGSTSFELADFNRDGYPDILYTCGDNADYTPVLKPYHGIYIFLNDGKNNFTQKYFFPMDGCFKAIARDFDGDGDPDIAAISFFADYKHHPEEGFIYLENKGNFQFQPYTFPEAASGRWITMDVGDLYGKGRQDIVLGNFDFSSMRLGATRDAIKGKPFIVLKNTGK